jgi:hypothetical protein
MRVLILIEGGKYAYLGTAYYMCPHTTYYICVLVLLLSVSSYSLRVASMHISVLPLHVSSYYCCICMRVLLLIAGGKYAALGTAYYMCPHIPIICVLVLLLSVSSYSLRVASMHISVLPPHVSSYDLLCMCPHTTYYIYVSSYYCYMCAHTDCMCPHTTYYMCVLIRPIICVRILLLHVCSY